MTRLVVAIAASLVVALFAAWLIGLPGSVLIEAAGYRLQPGLGTTIVVLLLAIVLVILAWSVLRRLLSAPKSLSRRAARKRAEQGVGALSSGLIALEAGDHARARSLAREARAKLPDNAAAQVLEARAELAMGDLAAAREHYKALITQPETAVAALAGLHQQAVAQGRANAALTFARKAVAVAPGLPWASAAVFNDLTRKGAWADALAMIDEQPTHSREQKTLKRRKQAVLQTALSAAAEEREPDAALEHAQAALKLVPDFVPAALIAARIHINRGDARKASGLLRRVWRGTGHPHVATLYANVKPGSSAVERLKRVRVLIEDPDAPAAAMVLARAAIDAYEWAVARTALEKLVAGQPSQTTCLLMAEIEEGQTGDQGKAREWLARAVHAPRDPVWTADGITSDEWEPVSPITGRLDAFEWKVPVSANAMAAPPAPSAALAAPGEIVPPGQPGQSQASPRPALPQGAADPI